MTHSIMKSILHKRKTFDFTNPDAFKEKFNVLLGYLKATFKMGIKRDYVVRFTLIVESEEYFWHSNKSGASTTEKDLRDKDYIYQLYDIPGSFQASFAVKSKYEENGLLAWHNCVEVYLIS